jgi:hypothetical protein
LGLTNHCRKNHSTCSSTCMRLCLRLYDIYVDELYQILPRIILFLYLHCLLEAFILIAIQVRNLSHEINFKYTIILICLKIHQLFFFLLFKFYINPVWNIVILYLFFSQCLFKQLIILIFLYTEQSKFTEIFVLFKH